MDYKIKRPFGLDCLKVICCWHTDVRKVLHSVIGVSYNLVSNIWLSGAMAKCFGLRVVH